MAVTPKITNTLSGKKELFKPLRKGFVGLYTCGPTVYQYAHIGNLRTYIFEDLLKRTLLIDGFKVKHVMNITDVGHLASDEDTGEDKVEREASREGKSAWDIARKFEAVFLEDLKALNILPAQKMPRATEHIDIQIKLIQKLEKKGFTYRTSDGIYFDTARLKDYGKLARKNIGGIRAGARVAEGGKQNPTDFALWKFSPQDAKRQMEWQSPWGIGFPGWHIECSAMSMKYLGETFDIHCGGIDHIQVHHQNEIAQSEAATGKPFVHYWLHGNFLRIENTPGSDEKMSKSLGNSITLDTLRERGFDPLDYRYLTLTIHWRKPMAFSWDALRAAQTARRELMEFIRELQVNKDHAQNATYTTSYTAFLHAINDDINAPKALSIVWKLMHDFRSSRSRNARAALKTMLQFDHFLGLHFKDATKNKIITPKEVLDLVAKRDHARNIKDWAEADQIRDKIKSLGWAIEDSLQGQKIKKL